MMLHDFGKQSEKHHRNIPVNALRREIIAIIDTKSDDDGWIDHSVIGSLLGQRYPGFDPRNYKYKKLSTLIESYGCFESKKESKKGSSNLYFRLRETKTH